MHTTTLPLGKYANDPRLQIVKVEKQDAIRTSETTIIRSGDRFQVWMLANPNAVTPEFTAPTLTKALAFVLGDPQKVGPVGVDSWLHTDGREYAHDPATTAMRRADRLHVGDVVDFPHLPAFEVTGDSEVLYDRLGAGYTAYPIKILQGGFNEYFRYGYGDLVPVRFGR